MCLAGFAMPADVDDIRMWRAPDHTRLVFDLSGAVDYELFTLTGPDRVVIDINDTAMRGNIDGLDFSDSPITAIRSGARDNNQLRVVLDLTAKVDPRSFTLPPNQEFGNRLVIDLYDLGPAPPASPSVANTPPPLDGKRDIVIAKIGRAHV